MKKNFAYDLKKFIEKNNLQNASEDEALFLFITDISKKNEYRNIINTILSCDKSLEIGDIISDLYLLQIGRENKNGYIYSTYTFKFDLLRIYKYYTSNLRKKVLNKVNIEDIDISYTLRSDVEFYDMIKDFSEEDKKILILYFKDNVSFDKIAKIVSPISAKTKKPISTRMGISFRIHTLLNKIRDKIKG